MASMQESTFLSVVTPFYNTASYLGECIESVLRQTHANFEYVLLDNASTDGSGEIARKFASIDKRIRLVRNPELLPQVPNYNRALTLISPQSRYCKIVQADDWLLPNCLELMVGLADTNPRIGLVSSLRFDGTIVKGDGLPYQRTILSGQETGRFHLLTPHFLFGSPTTVMYRSDAIRGRGDFFEEDRFQEDTEACFDLLADWDFGFVHQVLSYSRVEPDSIFSRLSVMDATVLGRMLIVNRVGRQFLDAAEFQALWERVRGAYYQRLAEAVVEFRFDAEYRAFHERELGRDGMKMEISRLARAILFELGDVIGNPKKSVGRILRRIRTR